MEELLRTRSGNFTLEESMTLSQVEEAVADGTIGEKLVSIDCTLRVYHIAVIIVSLIVKSQLKRLDNSHLFCSP